MMSAYENSNTSGKIFTKGKASGKFTCDRMSVTIKFRQSALSAAKASQAVTNQCERFLQRFAEAGADLAKIQLTEDDISAYHEEEKNAASRTLAFDCEAKADMINLLLKIIQDEYLDADISTRYFLSNEDDLRKSLRAEAVRSSKENAELLAHAAGKEIIGLDAIDMGCSLSSHYKGGDFSLTPSAYQDLMYCFSYSQKLSLPEKKLEEQVEAVWILG